MAQLLLFDIDGTLLHHFKPADKSDPARAVRMSRFSDAIRHAFGVETTFDPVRLTGMTDRQIIWEMVRGKVPREEFEEKFRHIGPFMHDLLKKASEKQPLYEAIPSAVSFVKRVSTDARFRLGILTGNVESIAWWKLDGAGLQQFFRFGLFGDDADDRIELAKRVFTRADAFFHERFAPADITVIGDTLFDIRCGKAIEARTVAVTTGGQKGEDLRTGEPDLMTSSLETPECLAFFGIAPPSGQGV